MGNYSHHLRELQVAQLHSANCNMRFALTPEGGTMVLESGSADKTGAGPL